MIERDCEGCGDLTRIKHLGKIRGKLICKKCKKTLKENHRKETINQSSEEEREKIKELSKKAKAEYNKVYNKKRKEKKEKSPPIPKGSKTKNQTQKSNSYLTFHERQALLRILMERGLDFKKAKERLDNLVEVQKNIREDMKSKNKSEEQIKIKQREMLEELWDY